MNRFNLLAVVCAIMSLCNHSLIFSSTEIEVKFQLLPAQEKKLFDCLDKYHHVGQESHVEHYLDNPSKSFYFKSNQGFIDALGSLRVRIATHKAQEFGKNDHVINTMCYKYRHVDLKTGQTSHRDEYETTCGDAKTMIDIFKAQGYAHEIVIKKQRKKYITFFKNAKLEICHDVVEKFGTFFEVELKTENDPQAGKQQLYDFLKFIGLQEIIEIDRSYIHMTKNPGYSFATIKKL